MHRLRGQLRCRSTRTGPTSAEIIEGDVKRTNGFLVLGRLIATGRLLSHAVVKPTQQTWRAAGASALSGPKSSIAYLSDAKASAPKGIRSPLPR